MRPLAERFWAKVQKTDGCWIWTAYLNEHGYGQIGTGGHRGTALAHRVSWVLAHGAIPEGHGVLHKCDTPACVRPDHLFTGTQDDNIADMVRKGRSARGDATGPRKHPEAMPRGEGHVCAKLTDADVRAIRLRLAEGARPSDVGRTFGVARRTIADIRNGKTWRHVAGGAA